MESSTREMLQAACPDPERWQRLESLLDNVADIPAWFEQVDESVFSLEDWVEALLAFEIWLVKKSIGERPVDNMIGYIHCCTMTMAETLKPPNLATLTSEMLDQYGFELGEV